MEHTLRKPYLGARSSVMRDTMRKCLGREPHEGDFIMVECLWAGQRGHEKCGWCTICNNPRTVIVKECKHPFEKVWKNEK